MRQFFTLLLFLMSQLVVGQFAVIQAYDEYVNVRSSPELGNNIISTLSNGQIIYYYNEPKGDWYEIEYKGENFSFDGYVHKSGFKPIRKFDSIQAKFRNEDSLVFQNDSVKITFTKIPFNKKSNQIQYSKADPSKNIGSYLEKINGKRAWGIADNIPKNQYGNIYIEWKGEIINLPKNSFDDLFEPNFEYKYTTVSIDKTRNRIYIYASNSDGAGGYDVLWIIENGKYLVRHLSNYYA